jgi:hypothetical protein
VLQSHGLPVAWHGIAISTVKSEATDFNCRQPAQSVNVSVQGKPVCKVFKYLGFHHVNGAAHMTCIRQLVGASLPLPAYMAFKLYDSLAMPAMLYAGCAVWGTSMLGSRSLASDSAVLTRASTQGTSLDSLLKYAPQYEFFREAGMYPLQYSCLHRMLAFLDSVLALDDGEYAKITMLDCIVDASSAGTHTWFSNHSISTLSELLTHDHGDTRPVDALHAADQWVYEC